jgi:hypothetical protein
MLNPTDPIDAFAREKEQKKEETSPSQLAFLRRIPRYLCMLYNNRPITVKVIGEHFSNPCTLPVVQYILPSSTVITIRDNLYDYAVSIDSPVNIMETFPLHIFINKDEEIHSFNFQGFPYSEIYEPYSKNQKKFSCHIQSQEGLSAFITMIAIQQRNTDD